MHAPTVALAALLAAAAALPAAADGPVLVEQRVYLHCTEQSVRQTNVASAPAVWDTRAPTSTLAQGGGCANADLGAPGATGPGFDVDALVARGTVDGLLDSLTLELDDAGVAEPGGVTPLALELVVDGRRLLSGVTVEVVPAPSPAGSRYTLTVSGIGLVDEDRDAGRHEVVVGLDRRASTPAAWLFDAADAPGGLVFNPAVPRGLQVPLTD